VVAASDYNKHDSEIAAIEQYIGTTSPQFPTGFSSFMGVPQGSSTTACSGTGTSMQAALNNLVTLLEQIRDDSVYVTSGTVLQYDNSGTSPYGGKIVWPSDWPMTYLMDTLPDNRQNATDPLPNPSYVTLGDVSNMPTSGYVSIINDVSTMSYQGASSNRIVHIPGYTSLATTSAQSNIVAAVGGVSQLLLPYARVFGLGTNMEFIYYDGLDTVNNRILNPQRMQLGTSATAHPSPNLVSPDLVFKGRASINIAPLMFKVNNGKHIDCLECYLRSDGTVSIDVRNTDVSPPDYATQTQYGYVHYSAILLRDLAQIPLYVPSTNQGGCS
jgi:hypothetical protein